MFFLYGHGGTGKTCVYNLEDGKYVVDFGNWILRNGNGEFEMQAEKAGFEISEDLLIKPTRYPTADIINVTYRDIHDRMKDSQYLQERAILAPIGSKINDRFFLWLMKKSVSIQLRCNMQMF